MSRSMVRGDDPPVSGLVLSRFGKPSVRLGTLRLEPLN